MAGHSVATKNSMTHQRESALLDPETKSARIEQLMVELSDESNPVNDLMAEHLESARSYLLSSMPEEYALILKLAREILPNIEDDALRSRIADFVRSQ
jgi:hypothetical protein